MKAMILKTPQLIDNAPLILEEVPKPDPAPHEILVKVSVCGICRTDLHVVEGDLPQKQSPLIPGHQVVGIVEACGKKATRFKAGTRVGVAWLHSTCGDCSYCDRNKENLCEESIYTGWTANGGYAEYCTVPEDYAYAIPDVFSDREAAPLLCAGIIGYRALKRSNIQPGEKLAFYGFGASAHIAIQVAKHWNCDVYVMTRDKKHQKLAMEMGAAWAGGQDSVLPLKTNSAIIFAPAGELIPVALEYLEKGGTLALAGIYMTPTPSMEYEPYLFYEKNICSVTANTREDGLGLLQTAAEIPIRTKTTAFSLSQANEALKTLKYDGLQGAGVLTVS